MHVIFESRSSPDDNQVSEEPCGNQSEARKPMGRKYGAWRAYVIENAQDENMGPTAGAWEIPKQELTG
jgi:hypothetical protein